MPKVYWSPEEVPGPEFIRRIEAWFSESSSRVLTLRRDLKSGLLRCTCTFHVKRTDTDLVRTFTCPVIEVDHALRPLSREDQGFPEMEPGDGPEGEHHQSCDCFSCSQEKLFKIPEATPFPTE